jgi:hypothetical protein
VQSAPSCRVRRAPHGGPGCGFSARVAHGAALAVLMLAPPADARPMDPVLSRLVVDPACQASPGLRCTPDGAQYTKLVSQLGFALAPQPVVPARTNGLAGFDVTLLASLTQIDASEEYWRRGTRGDDDALRGDGFNAEPDRYLQLYALELRKGLGFGVEAAASLGVLPEMSLLSWGAELRVALLEGMRYGFWRYLPDTSVGVALQRATGLGELALGTLAVDARLSHPFLVAGYALTPWLGYQWVRIDADSALVDLTPGVSAASECGYAGSNVPGNAGSPEAAGAVASSGAPAGTLDGSPLCTAGGGVDYINSVSFGDAEVQRQRALIGVSYRRELLKLGAQLITDLVRPDAAQPDAGVARALRCDQSGADCRPSPRQWTVVLELGASF